jgi:hypothetical protein
MARQQPHAQSKDSLVNRATFGAGATDGVERHRPGSESSDPSQTPTGDLSSLLAIVKTIKDDSVETVTNVTAFSLQILKRLDRIEQGFSQFHHEFAEFLKGAVNSRDDGPTHYTPATFAKQAVRDGLRDHMSPRTVQKWLRDGLLRGEKADPNDEQSEWLIPAEEYLAYRKRGGRPRAKNES